jgi:hypothetical protein
MIRRLLNPAAVLSLLLLAVLSPQALAQTAPAGMKFVCDGIDVLAKTTICELEVPADTIGTELEIKVPKEQFTSLSGLKASNDIPSSGVFFKLKAVDTSSSVDLSIDYADLTGKSTKTEPFGLVQFTIKLISVDPALFPMTIPGELQTDSVLFNADSLAEGVASFKVSAGTALPIVLNLGSGTTTTETEPGTIESSFTFKGNEGGGAGGIPNVKKAPVRYCFDDPISSMTDAEWEIVCDAKDRGIVSGNPRPNGVFFFPNQAINRAEAVKILTLGVLRSLGEISDADFDAETLKIKNAGGTEAFISYIDILYDENKEQPWFAVFVNIATKYRIVHGYREDNTYRAINKINNAESYRTIVEAGRVASREIAKRLSESIILTRDQDWFMKYAQTLKSYNVPHSEDYGKFTARKDYLIMVMRLLGKVGL